MSLIMDALKKTQQLRSKDSKGGPFFKLSHRNRRTNRRTWKIWGGAFIGIFLLLLAFWWVFLMAPAPPQQTISLVEKKPGLPIVQKESPEMKEEAAKPELVEEIKPSPPEVRKEMEKQEPIIEAKLASPKTQKGNELLIEKRRNEKTSIKPTREKKLAGVAQLEPRAPVEEKAPPSPSPQPPQKEEVSAPSIRAGGEVGKDHALISETIQHFNRGIASYHQGDIPKAIQAYQKVIEINPAYVEAYNNLGIIYQELGDFETALKTYQKAIGINPNYEKGLNNIGTLHYLKGEDLKAEEAFKKVLAINPNHIETHINLGTLYKKRGQLDKGIESYEKALAIRPSHGETHYNLGLLYEQMGKTDLAIHHYEQFVLRSSDSYPELASRVRRHINYLMRTKGGKKE